MLRRVTFALFSFLVVSCAGDGGMTPQPVTTPSTGGDSIRLQSRTFTPPRGVAADLATRVRAIGADRAHVFIQLDAPPDTRMREQLANEGIRLLDMVDRRTWTAAVTPQGAERLRGRSGIRWADLIQPQDKLSASLRATPYPYQLRSGNRLAYHVLFHKDVSPAEVRAFAERVGAQLEEFDARTFPVIRSAVIVVPAGRLNAIAEADIVFWVEPPPPPDKPVNQATAQPLANVDDVQAAPFNLTGAGVNVGIWEAGGTVRATHVDLTPRVTVEAGQTATTSNHAAHVAGTVGASGVNFPAAEGMAPQATIASWDSSGDAAEMTSAATSAGGAGDPIRVRTSNHSYAFDHRLGLQLHNRHLDTLGSSRPTAQRSISRGPSTPLRPAMPRCATAATTPSTTSSRSRCSRPPPVRGRCRCRRTPCRWRRRRSPSPAR